MKPIPREYVIAKIERCREAIAFAHPRADMSYARAQLAAAEWRLQEMDKAKAAESPGAGPRTGPAPISTP